MRRLLPGGQPIRYPRDAAASDIVANIIMLAMTVTIASGIAVTVSFISAGDDPASADIGTVTGANEVKLAHGGGEAVDEDQGAFFITLDGSTSEHPLSEFQSDYAGGSPTQWEIGEEICITCKFTGQTVTSVTFVSGGTVVTEWSDPVGVSSSNTAPTASFTSSCTLLNCTFDGTGSSDPDGSIDTWEWDWTDDGTFEGSGSNPSHTYGSPGTYTVVLRVTDDDGATNTTSDTVTVVSGNTGPTASFTFSPSDPETGENITFDGTGSSDPDGVISSYDWNWTNDSSYDGSGSIDTHSYGSPGTYTVVLRVTDDDGAQDLASQNVSVVDHTYLDCPMTVNDGTSSDCSFAQSDSDADAAATLTEENTGPGQSTKYNLDVEADFSGVPSGSHELEIRYKVGSADEDFDLEVRDGGSWTDRGDLTETSFTVFTYNLTSSEYDSGSPKIRFVDQDSNDGTQTSLDLDYVRVTTT